MCLQLIYYSRFVPGVQGAMSAVRTILHASEANNARDRLTGFLIFDKVNFLQILEGDAADVERTFERISRDPRHEGLAVIERRQIARRAFGDWAMGGYVRTEQAQPVYARHGLDGGIDPQALTSDQVVGLALDLIAFEAERRSRSGLSSSR